MYFLILGHIDHDWFFAVTHSTVMSNFIPKASSLFNTEFSSCTYPTLLYLLTGLLHSSKICEDRVRSVYPQCTPSTCLPQNKDSINMCGKMKKQVGVKKKKQAIKWEDLRSQKCIPFFLKKLKYRDFSGVSVVKNPPAVQETRVRSLGWEDPWRRKWQSSPVLLPGKSQGQRSLVGYSPWVAKSQTRLSDYTTMPCT